MRSLLLASFLGMAASACTDAEMCSGTYAGSNVAGGTCVSAAGLVYGTTQDPQCLAGAGVSCQAGTDPLITESACTGAGYIWGGTTCDQIKAAGLQCAAMVQAFTATGDADVCCAAASDDDDDDPCFPATAMITLADGTAS